MLCLSLDGKRSHRIQARFGSLRVEKNLKVMEKGKWMCYSESEENMLRFQI